MNRAHLICHPMKMGIYLSVIASDHRERGNPFSQYITGISPVIKTILKYFLKKEGFLKFMPYIIYIREKLLFLSILSLS